MVRADSLEVTGSWRELLWSHGATALDKTALQTDDSSMHQDNGFFLRQTPHINIQLHFFLAFLLTSEKRTANHSPFCSFWRFTTLCSKLVFVKLRQNKAQNKYMNSSTAIVICLTKLSCN